MRHLTPVSRVVGRQTLARHRNPWPLSASSTAWFSTAALHSTALPASALIPSPNASRGLLTAALTLKLLACGVLLHLKHKPASFSPIPLRRLCVQPASSLGVSFLVWATLTSTQTITSNYRNRYALYLAAQFNISAAAAFVELDEQFRVKNPSHVSEADVRDVRAPGSF
ncbi:hypothetical protein IWX47DRAFT_32990 [Phyllosticta citricarpa]